MIIIINTTEPKKSTVALGQKGEILAQKTWQKRFHESERLLPAIDSLLKKSKIDKVKLKGIVVVKGPGSFSAVRVGVTAANTLAYALNIPITGVKSSEFKDLKDLIKMTKHKFKTAKKSGIIKPYYSSEPNITIAKSRV